MIKVAFSKTFSFSILANSFLNMNLIQDMNILFATSVMIYWLLSLVCLSEVLQVQFLCNCSFLCSGTELTNW